jgi:hypothetical protein
MALVTRRAASGARTAQYYQHAAGGSTTQEADNVYNCIYVNSKQELSAV